MRPRSIIAALAAWPLLGCPAATPGPVAITTFQSGPAIEGVAKADGPLAYAVVHLLDPKDAYLRLQDKVITTTTDRAGSYRFQGSFPRGVPTIVAAQLSGNRRVVGFTVPGDGTNKVSLSVASTIVTEFLRFQARLDGKSMADFDWPQLAGIATTTEQLLSGGDLAVPDLDVAQVPAMNRAYAIAVGANTGGIGDKWDTLLGHRVRAMVTIAGTGEAGDAGDGKPAGQALLSRVRGAVADKFGHVYVADEGNERVRKIDAKTSLITSLAGTGRGAFAGDGGPADKALLSAPHAVAVDQRGNVFVADMLNCRIRRLDFATGLIETFAGNPAGDGLGGFVGTTAGDGAAAKLARFSAPKSLAFGPTGDLFVTDSDRDTKAHVVRKIDMKTGLITTVVGTVGADGAFSGDGGRPESARLNQPNQIAFDQQGRLLIADTANAVIRRVDFTGRSIATIAGVGGQPGDEPDGRPATSTRIDQPWGVAVGPDGRVYFSERNFGRIRTIDDEGHLRTVAGGGSDPLDGDARAVRLTLPGDLAFDPAGDMLVADTRGARLRRLVLRNG